MKIKLSEIDKKQINNDLTQHAVVRYLKHKENLKFNIGDVLIKQNKVVDLDGTNSWRDVKVSENSTVNRKFVYFYENEFGVGYVKQLKADGSGPADKSLFNLANMDHEMSRYVLDPDYADHLLLSDNKDNFDYAANQKAVQQARLDLIERNRALLEPTNTLEQVNALLAKLKIGDTFWVGDTIHNMANYGEVYIRGIKANGDIDGYRVYSRYNDYFARHYFVNRYVSIQRPYTLKDQV